MGKHDVLLSPVLATAAPKLGPQGPLVPGDQLIHNALNYVNYTPVYNISGQPAMPVPLGWNEQGLPIGSRFAARKGNENCCLNLPINWKRHAHGISAGHPIQPHNWDNRNVKKTVCPAFHYRRFA